jgi:hypothetical protein
MGEGMIPLFSYIFFFWHGSLILVVYEQRVHQGQGEDKPRPYGSSGLLFLFRASLDA